MHTYRDADWVFFRRKDWTDHFSSVETESRSRKLNSLTRFRSDFGDRLKQVLGAKTIITYFLDRFHHPSQARLSRNSQQHLLLFAGGTGREIFQELQVSLRRTRTHKNIHTDDWTGGD